MSDKNSERIIYHNIPIYEGLTVGKSLVARGYLIKTVDNKFLIQLNDQYNKVNIDDYGELFIDNCVEVRPETINVWSELRIGVMCDEEGYRVVDFL